MNYRHAYHAGNFADVFKHVVLVTLIQFLHRKNKPFCYLDTHAGAGRYDLFSSPAQKNKEFELGIAKILHAQNPPPMISDYLQGIQKINSENELRFYPGSPLIVKKLLHPEDKMILSELHPEEVEALKKIFAHDKQVAIHTLDGYQSLKAFLPPKEHRGLILIDPPYERADEFDNLIKSIPQALDRFQNGVFALWFPIKNRNATHRFLKQLTAKIQSPYLITELSIYPDDADNLLNGCGMLIINPPWQVDEELKIVIPWLQEKLKIS